MFVNRLGTPVLANAKSRRGRGLHRAQIVRFGHGSRHRTDDRNAIQNGSSVSGYLHSATRRWPPGSPGYGPNVWSADLNIYTSPSRGPVVRICRDEGRPDHDRLLGYVRRVVDPSNGLEPGWRGAWMQRTPPR